jgi:hypothetical protein
MVVLMCHGCASVWNVRWENEGAFSRGSRGYGARAGLRQSLRSASIGSRFAARQAG